MRASALANAPRAKRGKRARAIRYRTWPATALRGVCAFHLVQSNPSQAMNLRWLLHMLALRSASGMETGPQTPSLTPRCASAASHVVLQSTGPRAGAELACSEPADAAVPALVVATRGAARGGPREVCLLQQQSFLERGGAEQPVRRHAERSLSLSDMQG